MQEGILQRVAPSETERFPFIFSFFLLPTRNPGSLNHIFRKNVYALIRVESFCSLRPGTSAPTATLGRRPTPSTSARRPAGKRRGKREKREEEEKLEGFSRALGVAWRSQDIA